MSNLFDKFASDHLRRCRRLANVATAAGAVDLGLTVGYLLTNVLLGATSWDIYLLIFQTFHLVNWVAAFSLPAAVDGGAAAFVRMTFLMFTLQWVLDFAAVITRMMLGLYGVTDWGLLQKVNLGLVCAFLLAGMIAGVLCSMVSGTMNQQVLSIRAALDQLGSENNTADAYDQWRRVPEALRFAREQHRSLGMFQLYLCIVFVVFYCLGFYVNRDFQLLYWAQSLGALFWVLSYAVAEGVHHRYYLWTHLALLALDATASLVAACWRLAIVSSCAGVTTSGILTNDCGWILWPCWFAILLGLGECMLSVFALFLIAVVIKTSRTDQLRVGALKAIFFPERVTWYFSPAIRHVFPPSPPSSSPTLTASANAYLSRR